MIALFLRRYWEEILILFLVVLLVSTIRHYKNELSIITMQLQTAQADIKLGEIQKDALRQAITDQNDAVEKQRIDAVHRAEVFRMKSESIQAKYERERAIVRDLNGSQECDAMRKMIKESV